jgi:hypothetical protein
MLINTDPTAFAILMLITVALIGPFIFGCVFLVYYTIMLISPTPASPVAFQLNKLQLDTRIGCPGGDCYLSMFATSRRQRVFKQLGYFPSIWAIMGVQKAYRLRVRGTFEIIGDGVAHFEQDKNERPVWDMMDEMTGRIDLIGDRQLRRVSSVPPKGYSYVELFVPDKRNNILQDLGPTPLLQSIIDIDSSHRSTVKGSIWQKQPDIICVVKGLMKKDVWEEVLEWGARVGAGARIG